MRPITVYLDSNDYSVLSDSKRSTAQLLKLRNDLLELSESADVIFTYSGVHVSEMAPLSSSFNAAASARADLMVGLCGRHALISFDRLLSAELSCLVQSAYSPINVLTYDGTWFPEFDMDFSPINWATTIEKELKPNRLNRKSRRTLKKRLLKSTDLRSPVRDQLRNNATGPEFEAILRSYPMRPQDMQTIRRYVIGLASAKEVADAFLESLRDPRWMTRWFAEHHSELTPLIDWFRAPARQLRENISAAVAKMTLAKQFAVERGESHAPVVRSHRDWQNWQDEMLLNIVNREVAQRYPTLNPIENVALVDERCAGISTFVRSLHSSIWNSLADGNRITRESDVVDAVHAMYAPYVSLFRADRYMAPHIRRQVTRNGTTVVESIEDLPKAIHALLR